MLTIGIELNRAIIIMLVCILETSLKSTGKPEVYGQIEEAKAARSTNVYRIVSRAIIHNNIVILRIVRFKSTDDTRDILFLVIRRDYE